MLNTENEKDGYIQALNATYDLMSYTEIDDYQNSLRDMFYSFLYGEYADDQKYRSDVTYHFKLIYEFLDELKNIDFEKLVKKTA